MKRIVLGRRLAAWACLAILIVGPGCGEKTTLPDDDPVVSQMRALQAQGKTPDEIRKQLRNDMRRKAGLPIPREPKKRR